MATRHVTCVARATLGLMAATTAAGCSLLFPTEAGDDLAHFDEQAPQTGERVPDFVLSDARGGTVRLHDLVGNGPIVLQVGSHSCPVFRYRSYEFHDLYEDFADSAQFVILYTQEAHPEGSASPYRDEEWLTTINRVTRVRIAQPATLEERVAQAIASTEALSMNTTVAVDGMDNQAWKTFGSAPSPAFVIDNAGTIVLRQVWVDPAEIRDTLLELLAR